MIEVIDKRIIIMKGKCFLKLLDFSTLEVNQLLKLSASLKQEKKTGQEKQRLKNKNIVLVFEKTSTRTRCSTEVAAFDQGACTTFISDGSQMGAKESIKDTARVLGRLYDAIVYRGYTQSTIEILAQYSGVPVYNALTNEFHPTQVLADFLTIQEHTPESLSFNDITLTYIGDGKNNVSNSLLIGASLVGLNFNIIAPKVYQPKKELLQQALNLAKVSKAKIQVTDDLDAIKGSDFVYNDVWVSMGEPESVWQERMELLMPYQINQALLDRSANPNIKFMHCLPSYHNLETDVSTKICKQYDIDSLEVTEDVFESKASIVFDQTENRLHTIKAILVATLT